MAKPRVTLKEVATSAGVSYQTVSKVINHQVQVSRDTEERIWRAVHDLAYRPNYTARSLRSQRSYTLGYSWPPAPLDQANPILDQFLQSMFMAAEVRGYYLLCFPYHAEVARKLATYGELIDTGRVDAFILSSVEYNDPSVQFLGERHFPFMAFGRSNPELDFPWIDVDGAAGISMAVEHLLTLGHRKIAALAWPANSRVGNNRMDGYFSALRAANIDIRPEWIERGEGSYKVGFQSTLNLLTLPEDTRPTAIVAMNDLMAIGALAAIRQCGLLPGKDVAVTGFDDTPTARFLNPPLTSVSQPIWEIGQHLMERLISYLETGENPVPYDELARPQLVIRQSSTGIETDGSSTQKGENHR